MGQKAIKGVVLSAVVDDVNRLRESGRVTDDEASARLEAADLELLEGKVELGSWYPLACYARLTELLLEHEGRGDTAYLQRRGAASARRLAEAGIYQQMQTLAEGTAAAGFAEYRTRIRLVVSIHGAMLSCGSWKVEDDPEHADRIVIRVSDAADYPEVLRHALEGFINEASVIGGSEARWTVERDADDVLLFRMDRGFRS